MFDLVLKVHEKVTFKYCSFSSKSEAKVSR